MEYTIKLTAEQLQVIGQALGELPFRAAAPVFHHIEAQMRGEEKQEAQEDAISEKETVNDTPS